MRGFGRADVSNSDAVLFGTRDGRRVVQHDPLSEDIQTYERFLQTLSRILNHKRRSPLSLNHPTTPHTLTRRPQHIHRRSPAPTITFTPSPFHTFTLPHLIMSVDIEATLRNAETIAVVGLSGRTVRTSYQIARKLQRTGYTIVPVNPNYDEILGEPVVPSLSEIPEDIEIDIINIFRASEHTAGVVEEAISFSETRGQTPVVWTQLDVSSPEAETLAEEANLPYVRNRCIAVELARL